MMDFYNSLTLYEKAKFLVLLIGTIYCFNLSFFMLTHGLGVHWGTIFIFGMGLIILSWAASPKVPLIDIFNNEDVEESKLSERLSSFGAVFSIVIDFIIFNRISLYME
jgi:hypothetical protein